MCFGCNLGGHSNINIAQWCHVGSGFGSGIILVSGGDGVDSGGGFGVGIVIGSDRGGGFGFGIVTGSDRGGGFGVGIVTGSDRGGGHLWLACSVVSPTYFAIMSDF